MYRVSIVSVLSADSQGMHVIHNYDEVMYGLCIVVRRTNPLNKGMKQKRKKIILCIDMGLHSIAFSLITGTV